MLAERERGAVREREREERFSCRRRRYRLFSPCFFKCLWQVPSLSISSRHSWTHSDAASWCHVPNDSDIAVHLRRKFVDKKSSSTIWYSRRWTEKQRITAAEMRVTYIPNAADAHISMNLRHKATAGVSGHGWQDLRAVRRLHADCECNRPADAPVVQYHCTVDEPPASAADVMPLHWQQWNIRGTVTCGNVTIWGLATNSFARRQQILLLTLPHAHELHVSTCLHTDWFYTQHISNSLKHTAYFKVHVA